MTIIGIAGASGSGKTTISKVIVGHFGADNCVVISTDNYYKNFNHLSDKERNDINYDNPNTMDTGLLIKDLTSLSHGKSVSAPIYDFATSTRSALTTQINAKPIIIVEGIFALVSKELSALYDTKIFIDADADTCLIRRIERDMRERHSLEDVLRRYQDDVKPMHKQFIAPTKEKADLIIVNNSRDFVLNTTELFRHIDNHVKKKKQDTSGCMASMYARLFHHTHTATVVTNICILPMQCYVSQKNWQTEEMRPHCI